MAFMVFVRMSGFSAGLRCYFVGSCAAYSFCGCSFCSSMQRSIAIVAALRGPGLHVSGWRAAVGLGCPGSVFLIAVSIEMYLVCQGRLTASVAVPYLLLTWSGLQLLWLPRAAWFAFGGVASG